MKVCSAPEDSLLLPLSSPQAARKKAKVIATLAFSKLAMAKREGCVAHLCKLKFTRGGGNVSLCVQEIHSLNIL